MPRETVSTLLGEKKFEYTSLPSGKGLSLLVLVTRTLGPAMGHALAEGGSLAGMLANASSALGSVVETLCGGLDEASVSKLVELLASGTQVQGAKGMVRLADVYEETFRGDMLGQLAWLKWALEVELGPLGSALKALMPASAKPNASAAAAS